jgi:nucleoside phosphorylase
MSEDGSVAVGQRYFDIGVVIPLAEEFRYFKEVMPQLESISHAGMYFYSANLGSVSAVCCVAGQIGTLPALQAATRLLQFADVKMLVVLGVAGALDGDASLGDVVVASEVNEFQANSKAESIEGGYEVRYSGRHWSVDFPLREALTNFEFSGKLFFDEWKMITSNHYSELGAAEKKEVTCEPLVHFGPIASGNVVAASPAFVNELKRIDRKFLAIDMEAAGVAFAAEERIHPLPWLVVRGISDRADDKKKTLDAQGKGPWRRYAVRNAASFLVGLLKWPGFLKAAGLSSAATPSTDGLAAQLATALKSCIGGPWLVGLAFGVYEHGPAIIGTSAVPVDLSRLRVLDSKIRKLVDAAQAAKNSLLVGGDISKAAKSIIAALDLYHSETNSPRVQTLIQGFDQVVMTILCPDEGRLQIESLLLQAEKLEEETGAEAAAEFLREFTGLHRNIRERYVDALATAGRWKEITELVGQNDVTHLSRLELENGFSACAEMGLPELASRLIKQHESAYTDNSAKMFRGQITKRYPQIGSAWRSE